MGPYKRLHLTLELDVWYTLFKSNIYAQSVNVKCGAVQVWDDKIVSEIVDILDKRASVLVGILMRRVENLSTEDALSPDVYKAIAKDTVYEQFRELKQSVVPRLLPKVICK